VPESTNEFVSERRSVLSNKRSAIGFRECSGESDQWGGAWLCAHRKMNREKRWAFATACLCMIGLVTACSPRRATATLIVQTEDAPTQQMNLAAEILAQRFLEIRPSMF
jgi:hypothetical protein